MEKTDLHKPKIDLFNPDKIFNQDAVNKAIDDGKLDFLLNSDADTLMKDLATKDIKSKGLNVHSIVLLSNECKEINSNDTKDLLNESISDLVLTLGIYHGEKHYSDVNNIGTINLKDYADLLPVQCDKDNIKIYYAISTVIDGLNYACNDMDMETIGFDGNAVTIFINDMLRTLDTSDKNNFIIINTVYHIIRHTVAFNKGMINTACQPQT